MTTLLISLILICAAWAVVASLLITRNLEQHGISVEFLWLRAKILIYLGEYRKITLEETGHVGLLFYHYVIPLCIALALAIILVVGKIGRWF